MEPEGGSRPAGLPDQALLLRRGDQVVGACGVIWRTRFGLLPRFGIREAWLGPFRARAPDLRGDREAEASLMRAMLRELIFGDRVWHVLSLRLDAGREPVASTATQYAVIHRLPVSVTYHEPGPWTEAIPEPAVPCELRVRIFEKSLKGRMAKHFAGSGGEVRSSSPTDTVGRTPDRESEMLYFALDISRGVAEAVRDRIDPSVADLEFREAKESEMYPGLLEFGENLQLVERSLRAGDRCVVGLRDGRIVFHMWASENPAFLASLYPPEVLQRRSVHGYGSHTVPELRKKGVYLAGLSWFVERARARGVEQIVGQAAAWNLGAVKALERLGFDRIDVSS